ncbi:GDP-L-fucose synthase [Candidatus Parcubacteria bacterium]|nr:GDP-L-fucose synthase [Candidatus Parcubacteria bacterium]
MLSDIDLKTKKILITGAHGFLGRHLVKNLLEKRKVPKENLFLPSVEDLDFKKWENCQKAVVGQDIVIHLAAMVGGIGANLETPGEFFYDNIIMGVHLMEASRQAGVEKFTALGTICCYPKFTPIPFKEKDLWSGYPEETNAPYGLAKKMLLVQAQAYRKQYGFNAIYLLPVNMYGPGDSSNLKKSHVVAAIIRKIYEAKKDNKDYIEVWGTGKPTREFLYVEDGAEGIILATEHYNKPEPINIGAGKEISIKDLVELICDLMDFKGEIRWDSSKPDGQPRRCLDTSKAKKEFGFEAKVDFKEGLKRTIQWYKEKIEQNYEC